MNMIEVSQYASSDYMQQRIAFSLRMKRHCAKASVSLKLSPET